MKDIRKTPRSGGGSPVHRDEKPIRFVALTHQRFGDGYLEPGDPVPIERGRNYGSMVRNGLIQQVIEPHEKPAARTTATRPRRRAAK